MTTTQQQLRSFWRQTIVHDPAKRTNVEASILLTHYDDVDDHLNVAPADLPHLCRIEILDVNGRYYRGNNFRNFSRAHDSDAYLGTPAEQRWTFAFLANLVHNGQLEIVLANDPDIGYGLSVWIGPVGFRLTPTLHRRERYLICDLCDHDLNHAVNDCKQKIADARNRLNWLTIFM